MTRKTRRRLMKTGFTLLVASMTILMVLPLIWMLSASLKLPTKIFSSPIQWIPQNPNWDNYTEVWNGGAGAPFSKAFVNSLFVTLTTLMGSLLICSLAAYAFSKIDFKGKTVVFFLYLATMMVPSQVTLIPRFLIMGWLSLNDTLFALILPGVFHIIAIFTLRQFFNKIPDELMESARIDGAGHGRIYWQIVLPISVPALMSASILIFVRSWNDYMNPLIFLNTQSRYTITLAIKNYLNMDGQPRYDLAMAASVISLVPIILFFVSVQRYYFDGVMTSGLKG